MAGMLVCLPRYTGCEIVEGDCRQVGKGRIRKTNSRTGGGQLIAEDQGPGLGPVPAFVLPNRDRPGPCGGHCVLSSSH